MHEHALTAHHGGGYIAAAVAPDAAGRFLQDYRHEENKRDWQSYLLGASVTAEMGGAVTDISGGQSRNRTLITRPDCKASIFTSIPRQKR